MIRLILIISLMALNRQTVKAAPFTVFNFGVTASPALSAGGNPVMSGSYIAKRSLWNGFSYNVDYPTVGGAFNGLSLPSIPAGGRWDFDYSLGYPFAASISFTLSPPQGFLVVAGGKNWAAISDTIIPSGTMAGWSNAALVWANHRADVGQKVTGLHAKVRQPDGSYKSKVVKIVPLQ